MNLPLSAVDQTDNLDAAQYIDLALHGVDSSDSSDSDSDEDFSYANNDSSHEGTTDVENTPGTLNASARHNHNLNHSPSRKKRKKRKVKTRLEEHNNPVVFVADTVREVGGVVLGATSSVVGATTGLFTAAVAHTPIISKTVKAFVHR